MALDAKDHWPALAGRGEELKIVPISADSMGTRSMATYVETDDTTIVIDPGVSLAPLRYGLPPHEIEVRKMEEDWKRIVQCSMRSQVLIITHYHYDHHDPNRDLEIYDGKTLLIKHPKESINRSQRGRAAYFLSQIEGRTASLEHADGREFSFGNTMVRFSRPVFHGSNQRLGYVVEVLIDDGKTRLVYTSDVEGPSLDDQLAFILESRPHVLMVDGPMTYMLGYRYSLRSLEASVENLKTVMRECPVRQIIIDHHLLRDLQWRARISEAIREAEKRGVEVISAAEYLGEDPLLLEAKRKELYGMHRERRRT